MGFDWEDLELATKSQEMQRVIRLYKQQTGETEIDMHEVARYAVNQLGMVLPTVKPPLELLSEQFSQAAREEIRYDSVTKKPYRANHAVHALQGYLWVDIDEAPREPMQKSMVMRREQIVGDAVQLSLDADHWNSIHPKEDPIIMPLDFTDDVEWRKNSP